MKTLVLCNSDWLALPAINQLHQQGMLAGIAVTTKSAAVLIPALMQIGIAETKIFKLEKQNFEQELRTIINTCQPQIAMVFTFPWKIPASLLQLPLKGFLNFHFGVLPQYKGTDPVFWQLKNGEKNGGISVHIMTEDIDEGPLLFVQQMPIIPGETYGIHCQRLGALAAQILQKAKQAADSTTLIDNAGQGEFYRAPTLPDLTINWQIQTAAEIENLINAANPRYGGAATTIRQTRMQILEVSMADLASAVAVPPGTIVYADALYGLVVSCINNEHLKINIVRLPEGYISGSKLFNMGFRVGEVFI